MKKIICLLCAMMMIVCTACGSKMEKEDPATPTISEIKDSLELLTTVWDGYAENDKFSAAGGDMENIVMDAPGAYSTEDAQSLDSMLGFPQDCAEQIDNAASLMHMMNQNTFTAAAYCVKDPEQVTALGDQIKENIKNRQWMCGFPDKMVICQVDYYLVSCFGEKETIDSFVKQLSSTYSQTKILTDEAIQ